ncbi:hypothetical protein DXO170_11550 [Xanthomonas oryzae pv. oryzae]|nr:hypothetical protein ATY42_08365 [Xanthomonas oryzae pv. oryzae]AOS18703.1 hypothetical protein ATY46_08595 [Xanthomonas oryzae pv. oryzae]AOS22870.1 hypothetical protein ATY47_08630 [Xanthomonas oryzae pv. oryzae]AZK83100.1 hypothetical protein BO992_08585 [Xanthomonas oryzae pv. oryzae]OLG54413.1 hypothetical protein BXO34_09235 [Xanthomonas oryzae pv. oryzae]
MAVAMLTICMMRVGNSHPNYNAWYKIRGRSLMGIFVELLTDTAVVGELHQPECIPLTFDRDGIT